MILKRRAARCISPRSMVLIMMVTYLNLIVEMILDVLKFLIYAPDDTTFSFFPFYLLVVLSLLLVGCFKKVFE